MQTPPNRLLEIAIPVVGSCNARFCLVGGLAASLYRKHPRTTVDLDIALVAEPESASREVAERIVSELGYSVAVGCIDTTNVKLENPAVMIIGREPGTDDESALDILLPALPWVEQAVSRAQHNSIDFGFSNVPTITIEDIIIAKAYALKAEPHRFQDLDDLKEIFLAGHELDLVYIVNEFKRHELGLPKPLRDFIPAALKRFKANW